MGLQMLNESGIKIVKATEKKMKEMAMEMVLEQMSSFWEVESKNY
jgi:hypothetical protein